MPKLVKGPAPSYVIHPKWQFDKTLHQPLDEQYQTFQNQALLETIAWKNKNPIQTVTISEITLSDKTLEIYLSLHDFTNQET